MAITEEAKGAGRQFVTYTVFVATMAVWTSLAIAFVSSACWIYARDSNHIDNRIEAVSDLAQERWSTHTRIEQERDNRITSQLDSISAKIDRLQDRMLERRESITGIE